MSALRQQSETLCGCLVHQYYAPIRPLASHRLELRSRLYPHLPWGGSRPIFVFPVSPLFRLRVSHYLSHTFPLDDTRSPWVTHVSSPPCRPQTPWYDGEEPNAFATIVQAQPFPIFGRPVHSSGWLPLITTRWFSASPSDPTSRWTPCPPRQSLKLLPRPMRSYPHLWIST